MQGIPAEEKIFIGGDFNGHVGNSRSGFENVHGGEDMVLRIEMMRETQS